MAFAFLVIAVVFGDCLIFALNIAEKGIILTDTVDFFDFCT